MKPTEEFKDRTRQKLLKLSFREKASGKMELASESCEITSDG